MNGRATDTRLPPQSNLCEQLIALYKFIEHEKSVPDDRRRKADFCDDLNSKVTDIMKKMLCTPYTTNFNLRVDPAPAPAALQRDE